MEGTESSARRLCPRCGKENEEGANFCSNCGAPLSDSGEVSTISFPAPEIEDEFQEAHVEVEPPPTGAAVLFMKRGPLAGAHFVLDKNVTTIGRHPESDIYLDDITVSRRHAEVVKEQGAYVIRDVGSLNGTYVNRERVEQRLLQNGDEVQIGKFKLVFLFKGEPS